MFKWPKENVNNNEFRQENNNDWINQPLFPHPWFLPLRQTDVDDAENQNKNWFPIVNL